MKSFLTKKITENIIKNFFLDYLPELTLFSFFILKIRPEIFFTLSLQ